MRILMCVTKPNKTANDFYLSNLRQITSAATAFHYARVAKSSL